MPKRTDIQKILIIGAGPIVIGQACEFDYSGTQACKALKEEGYTVVLLNSNPATIMTDPDFADRTYIEPVTPEVLARIIEKERPDALLPTLGGQTALNTAVAVAKNGTLEKFGVELIGAKLPAIEMAEDRTLFKQAMERIGVAVPRSRPGPQLPGGDGHRRPRRLPGDHPPFLHPRRHRRRHRLQPGGIRDHGDRRHRRLADQRNPGRGVGDRLEGVRAGGDARSGRQRRHHLLHREFRSDGSPYRRLHHRRSGADPDRQGIPDPARRLDQDHSRDRRRDRAVPTSSSASTPRTAGWWSSR